MKKNYPVILYFILTALYLGLYNFVIKEYLRIGQMMTDRYMRTLDFDSVWSDLHSQQMNLQALYYFGLGFLTLVALIYLIVQKEWRVIVFGCLYLLIYFTFFDTIFRDDSTENWWVTLFYFIPLLTLISITSLKKSAIEYLIRRKDTKKRVVVTKQYDFPFKAVFISLYGFFVITALITHVWTVFIAFTEGGLLEGIITLFLPFFAEIYWMSKMFGENDLYAWIALIHIILALPFSLIGRR